jgi:FkbM family methyltransferase
MLRLSLLAVAAEQQRAPVPDLSSAVRLDLDFGVLYLPVEDQVILPTLRDTGTWEAGETAIVRDRLKPGMTFVDVGAHVGYFACLAARLVGPRGLVLCFEPSPRNYELLLANVWVNGLTNVVCFPWAVADTNGFEDLYLSPDNSGDHRLFAGEGREESLKVRTVAVDTLSAVRPPVDFVKIDVQGGEDRVVRGMRGLLQASASATLLVEYWPHGIRLRGGDERAVLDFYRELGYRRRVQNPYEVGFSDLGDDEILEYCRGEGGIQHTNLLLTED